MDGNICYIDGVPCTRFKATLLNRKIENVTVVNHDDWLEGAPQPIELKESTFSYSKITLKYFVEGVNEKDTLKNISNLIKSHIKANITFSDLNYHFNVKLTASVPEQIKHENYEVTLTLQSDFKLDQNKSVNLSSSGFMNCSSNVDTPAILTIVSEENITDIEIALNSDSFIIPSLKKGDILEINGEDYTIKVNGVDNLLAVDDIWSFPLLKSGSNEITINKENISVKIDYIERFI